MRKTSIPCLGRWSSLALASPILSALLAVGPQSVQAGSAFFDFNSDPTQNGQLTLFGNGAWQSSGGVGSATNANDGYLVVTASQSSQRSAIVFADIDQGEVVAAFTFEADFRIGNGTQNPADGFSVNYVRANDPVLTDVAAGGNPATDGNIWATGPNCEANLPEEGTQTGIAIGFDVWNSGGSAPYCNEADQSIGPDIIGLDVRVDGTLVLQAPMTTQNGAVSDPTSSQTGPYDGSNSFTNLGWAHLKVVMDTNQQLSVTWKGKLILSNYQTAYFPSAGALVFAGRTGSSWENQHVDNIKITTIGAALALVGGATGSADGFSVQITDSGNSTVDTTKPITVSLDGTALPSANLTVTKTGASTVITYHGFPTLLAPGSKHDLVVNAKDTNNNTVTGSPSFTVPTYATLDAGTEATGVDTTKPGFRMMPWQSGIEPNQIYWANEQVAGLHGANNANLSGATDGGYIDFTSVLNFNITPASSGGGDAGQFTTANGYPDSLFPGIPGANGLNGSSAEEILTFLQFKSAGIYQMAVDSDDGFAVTSGKNPKDRFSQVLGEFNGGRGEGSPTYFTIAVTNAGIYPVRLLWENGNGEAGNGAGLEWFSVQPDGTKILVNDPDPTNTTGIAAFYAGPALPAYVSQLNPYPGEGGARPDQVIVQITDGAAQVNGNSIALTVDGASSPAPQVSKSGSVTTAKLSYPTSGLLAPGSHTATLVWADNANTPLTHSNSWTFTVMNYSVTLDASLSVPASAVDKTQPGFNLEITQVDPSLVNDSGDGLGNTADENNALLAGLYFPWYGTNTIDLQSATGVNAAAYTNNMYIWTNAVDFNDTGSGGDFAFDYTGPGLPGLTLSENNFARAFDAWVIFPSAGFYVMGVNSDDGFRLSEGQGITRQVLHVTGAGIDTDVAAVVSYTNWNNGGFGGAPPIVPISAEVVYVNSNNFPGVNLTGKIALVDNGFFGISDDSLLCYIAQTNGAVGFIEINKPANGMPYRMGGTPPSPVTIPALNVSGFGGQRDWWLTNGTLSASIGADAHIVINADEVGKGMSHVDGGFIVPAAGAYPLHLLYWQGGGGAGLEWTSVGAGIAANGPRSLVNDTTDSASLLAYQPTAAQGLVRPNVSIKTQNGTVTITYTGTLQSSSTVNGTYQNVQGASSPYTVPSTGTPGAQFFRAH